MNNVPKDQHGTTPENGPEPEVNETPINNPEPLIDPAPTQEFVYSSEPASNAEQHTQPLSDAPLPPPPATAPSAGSPGQSTGPTVGGGPKPAAGQMLSQSLVGVWTAFTLALRGRPVEAFALAARVPQLWIVAFSIAALTTGLFLATNVARVFSAADTVATNMVNSLTGSYGSYRGGYFALPFGDWLLLVLVGAIFAAIAFFLRALVLHWLFMIRGARQPFATSANILSVSYAGHVVIFAVTFVLLLLPLGFLTPLIAVVAAAFIAVLSFAAELWIYIGVNRAAYFAKSAVLPHTLLTAAWIFLTWLTFTVLIVGFISSLV